MANLDLAALTAPVTDDEPCGPDLDLDEDDAYVNFMTGTEMALPEDYMVVDTRGDRVPFHTDARFEDLDLGSKIGAATRLLGRTHDLRLLFLTAKLCILNRVLADFCTVVAAMAALCESFWDDVHPRAEGGAYTLRIGTLERLDEMLIIAALNNATLFRSKVNGVISWVTYRSIVRKAAGDREDADTAGLDRRLAEENRADPAQLMASQAALRQLRGALSRIRDVCARHVPAGPPNLRRLTETVTQIGAMLDRIRPPEGGAEADRDGASGDAEGAAGDRQGGGTAEAAGVARVPAFATTEAAARALDAATAYFALAEPSSPALLLLRQAQALVGKSFLQAVEALWPEQAQRAFLNIGSVSVYNVPLTKLAENGASLAQAAGSQAAVDMEAVSKTPSEPLTVTSRAAALGVLEQVGAFYRNAEPSSPIPLLIERARALVGRDFMTLLRAVLPEEA